MTEPQLLRRKPPATDAARPAPPLTARRCACGGVAGVDGECAACRARRLSAERGLDGRPLVDERYGTYLSLDQGPHQGSGSGSGSGSGGHPAPACPTGVKVVAVGNVAITSADAAAGWRTGWGGFALMEVSGPGRTDWDGAQVHENLHSVSNTCSPGTAACPNTGGQGGAAGSTFTVGDPGGTLLGLVPSGLPAKKNCFYDIHMYAEKRDVCGDAKLASCKQTCTQRYDCGGKTFGPTFTIARDVTHGTVPDPKGGAAIGVSQVAVSKS